MGMVRSIMKSPRECSRADFRCVREMNIPVTSKLMMFAITTKTESIMPQSGCNSMKFISNRPTPESGLTSCASAGWPAGTLVATLQEMSHAFDCSWRHAPYVPVRYRRLVYLVLLLITLWVVLEGCIYYEYALQPKRKPTAVSFSKL